MRVRVCRVNSTRRVYSAALLGLVAALAFAPSLFAQDAPPVQPSQAPQSSSTAPGEPPQTPQATSIEARPLAIVPIDSKIPGFAAEVTGGLQILNGRGFIAASGSITSGSDTTQVTLPYRGTLRICASTTVSLTTDSSVPKGEIPGLLMAMDHGAIEASFATGRNSDQLITPDFRILIGGPGAAEVKVRLAPNGDTCVDNAGVNAPYVLVSGVFDGGAYHVQSGQRVMFQHGSIQEVVDQEKEPCGCPPAPKGANEFPLAQSEGLAPTLHPAPPPPAGPVGHPTDSTATLAYNSVDHAPKPVEPTESAATPQVASPEAPAVPTPKPPAPKKKPGFFKHLGNFFRKVFGAD
jgi:hypothetical protein